MKLLGQPQNLSTRAAFRVTKLHRCGRVEHLTKPHRHSLVSTLTDEVLKPLNLNSKDELSVQKRVETF